MKDDCIHSQYLLVGRVPGSACCPNGVVGRASVLASPHVLGIARKSGLTRTLALPSKELDNTPGKRLPASIVIQQLMNLSKPYKPWVPAFGLAGLFCVAFIAMQALAAEKALPLVRLDESDFGRRPDGKVVKIYTLRNVHGMVVKVMTLGATMTELWAPDRDGKSADVVLGADTLGAYLAATTISSSTMSWEHWHCARACANPEAGA